MESRSSRRVKAGRAYPLSICDLVWLLPHAKWIIREMRTAFLALPKSPVDNPEHQSFPNLPAGVHIMWRLTGCVVVILAVGFLPGQRSALSPDPNAPRPIEAVDSVWIEELTW